MLAGWPRALKVDKIEVAHTQYNIPLLGAPCLGRHTPCMTCRFVSTPTCSCRATAGYCKRWSRAPCGRPPASSPSRKARGGDILRFYPQVPKDNVRVVLEAADARFHPPAGGQETARAAANKALNLDDRPYLLAVGVLQPRKNLALLLDAFALVKLGLKIGGSPPPHRLVVAGKRGWLDDTDAQLAALPEEVTRDIVLAGYVADEDLPALYGGAEALCCPSRYEGFGLPPLEALACGCPVLCSRSSSLPEVVGDSGILLPPDDSDAWARALGKLLSAPPILARWRERGPARAALFSWEKAARETLEVYEECVK